MTEPVKLYRHGGRLADAALQFPDAPCPWVDLSTGINPHAWAGPRADGAALRRLPDPAETAALEAGAAAAFGVRAEQVIAFPGAEAALRALPRLTGARSVAIMAPTYGGHAQAWAAASCAVHPFIWQSPVPQAGALVVVNPNNPDGRALPVAEIMSLASPERLLIVDESFVEVTPELSVAAQASERVIVLRSFGKFYGLAGVRLGFLLAGPGLCARLRAELGDWPVSAEAIAAGRGAYADPTWADATRVRLTVDAARLDALLRGAGFEIVGGTSLFRLTASPRAGFWFNHLAGHGILLRPFAYQPGWLRFGLPGTAPEWARLETALREHA